MLKEISLPISILGLAPTGFEPVTQYRSNAHAVATLRARPTSLNRIAEYYSMSMLSHDEFEVYLN